MKKLIPLLSVLVLLCGCQTFNSTLTGAAVELASCELAQAKPAAVPFLKASGDVFIAFGNTTPPTPATLQSTLDLIPIGTLTQTERNAIWIGTVEIYKLIYAPSMTVEKQRKVQLVLTTIGNALKIGSTCGVTTTTVAVKPVTQVHQLDVEKLTKEIEKVLRKVR